jgi:glycine/D-amino acid oxidase-like deaminating enzyme
MVAGGLSLRHYESFAMCPSMGALKARVALERPDLDRYGIHVMLSQHASGQIIMGDSHEYDAAISPFDSTHIDELIMEELRSFVELPSWRVVRRWSGQYAKVPGQLMVTLQPQPNAWLIAAAGGSGMTMAFAHAEDLWGQWH